MPPKKKATQPSQKTVQKKKEKIIEDKTFGLKNKKGKKQQDYVKQLSNQVKYGQQSAAKVEQKKFDEKKRKGDALKEKDEIDKLFRPVSQKASAGADPKSVLCAFYKQGTCSKGDKCKFSHDLSLDRKTEKRSVYIDTRDDENLQEDTMDKWDQQKLEEVVNKKHGSEKAKPRTEIVCKYFLEAIEKNLYGWFWTCPNGGDKCMYRHALPPGFVLKKDTKKEEHDDTVSLEELIESKRANLRSTDLTKVTFETFMVWKKNRLEEKRKKLEAETKKKKAEMRAGRTVGISGREVFQFQPSLIKEGDDDDDAAVFERREETAETNNIKYIDLTFEKLLAAATDDEPTNTKKQNDGNKSVEQNTADNDDDDNKLGEAAGYSNVEDDTSANAVAGNVNVDIDEDLFMDEIDDELENLELAD